MAFVSNKDFIVGKLTQLGYKQLLEGKFNPKYVVLSDDGIDYSLIDTTNVNDPYNKLRETPIIEPSSVQEGYKYRLISLPTGFQKLPLLNTNTENLSIKFGQAFTLTLEIKNFNEAGYFIRTNNKAICYPQSGQINVISNLGTVNLITGQTRMVTGSCVIQIEAIESGIIKNIPVTVTA